MTIDRNKLCKSLDIIASQQFDVFIAIDSVAGASDEEKM